MKQRLLLFALLLVGAASCQEIVDVPEAPETMKITAAFAEATTKVAYAEDPTTHKLHQTWEVGDLLYGFDEDNNALCLRVASVDGEGVATLEINSGDLPASGKRIHMLYAPGGCLSSSSGAFTEGSIPTGISLLDQTAATGTSVPAILTADALVSGSSVSLVFTNQTAILGIKGFHGLPAGASVSAFSISGINVYANITVAENALALNVLPFPGSVAVNKAGGWTANASGAVGDVFYVAAFPSGGPVPVSITAALTDGSVYVNELGSKTIAAAKYYYMDDKELSKCVAEVQLKDSYGFPASMKRCLTLEDAFAEANAAAAGISFADITLLDDCTLTSDIHPTNASLTYTLDLNGHTLTVNENHIVANTPSVQLSVTNGMVNQSTDGSPVAEVSDGFLSLFTCALSSSGSSPILNLTGGYVEIYDNAVLVHSHTAAKVITVSGGQLDIYGGARIEHTNASGNNLLYVSGGTPRIWIGDGSQFIQAGIGTPLLVDSGVAGGAVRVTVDGAYFYTNSTQTLYSVNSGIIEVKSAWFNKENPCMNCVIAPNCTVGKIVPVSYFGKVYNRRIIGSNAAYDNTKELFVPYSVAADKQLYPAKTNITYTVSTGAWAFRPSSEGYSTAYDADLISLFTWGYDPVKSINPAGTDYLVTETYNPGYLEPEKDWGSVMNAGNCRVPTQAEWDYLLNTRSASTVEGVANARYMKCVFQDTKGLMLFPDDFTLPSVSPGTGTISTAINNPSDNFSVTLYRADGNKMIAAGCVFLPMEGYRNGSTVATTSGNYWSATGRADTNAFFLSFGNLFLDAASYTGSKNAGHSVRLFFE